VDTSERYLSAELRVPADDFNRPGTGQWAALRDHRLTIQRCNTCGKTQNPAEDMCHHCHSFDLGWADVPARGEIFSWTRVWHPSHPSMKGRTPYIVLWVECDHPDQPRFVGNLLGDPMQPVEIGMRVEGIFQDFEDGTLLNWVVANGGLV
jgi:uncharacterized OB-fold protein